MQQTSCIKALHLNLMSRGVAARVVLTAQVFRCGAPREASWYEHFPAKFFWQAGRSFRLAMATCLCFYVEISSIRSSLRNTVRAPMGVSGNAARQ